MAESWFQHKSRVLRKEGLVLIAALLGLGVLFAADSCGGPDDSVTSETTSDPASRKYEQTWPRDYAGTTCAAWSTDMLPQQQFAAAADMLAGARNKGDGGMGLPADALIVQFQTGIAEVCSASEASSLNIAEVGATLYLTERETFRP